MAPVLIESAMVAKTPITVVRIRTSSVEVVGVSIAGSLDRETDGASGETTRSGSPPPATHCLLLLLLSLPPRREVARAVEKCHDQDPVVLHFVQQPILEHNELANRRIVELAHEAPAL
jgi:hypothetical protein